MPHSRITTDVGRSPPLPVPARPLAVWLGIVCALIVAMVVVGGITRLTQSGLSIVEWKPVTGVLPPLSQAAWEAEFAKYQRYPQFHLQFHGQLTLEQYQRIFFWEWFHRLLGRVIGLAYAVPFAFWALRGRLGRPLTYRLAFGLVLGGLQGLLGWFMVQSGLVAMPHVSHYRLAAHLLLALTTLAYLLWVAQDILASEQRTRPVANPVALRRAAWAFFGLVVLQTTWGAFVAGLRAGYGYPTWPTMNGDWVPPGFWTASPWFVSPLEHPPAVQFVHRTLGLLVLASASALGVFGGWRAGHRVGRSVRNALLALVVLTWTQVLLGIFTILGSVPITLAALHQTVGCLLFATTIVLLHRLSSPRVLASNSTSMSTSASTSIEDAPNPS